MLFKKYDLPNWCVVQRKAIRGEARQSKTIQCNARQYNTRLGKTRQDSTGRDKTRRGKTMRDKTRQCKTRQDNARKAARRGTNTPSPKNPKVRDVPSGWAARLEMRSSSLMNPPRALGWGGNVTPPAQQSGTTLTFGGGG